MKQQDTLPSLIDSETSAMFAMSLNAFNLITEGKETEAHSKFPVEYHLIKKYEPLDINELFKVLNRKLEVF